MSSIYCPKCFVRLEFGRCPSCGLRPDSERVYNPEFSFFLSDGEQAGDSEVPNELYIEPLADKGEIDNFLIQTVEPNADVAVVRHEGLTFYFIGDKWVPFGSVDPKSDLHKTLEAKRNPPTKYK